MSADVGFLAHGIPKWYSQRTTGRPYADCMFASLCTPLSFMGYDLPATIVADLRAASGIPHGIATSTAATKTAVHKLLPDADLQFTGLSDESLQHRLLNREIAARVMVH